MTCNTHMNHGSTCTKSCTGDTPDGIIGAVRKLKYWALLGQDVETKGQHKLCWRFVEDQWAQGLVPTLEELDESMSGGGAAAAGDMVPLRD